MYKDKNKEKLRRDAYREEHRVEIKEWNNQYYKTHREEIIKRTRRHLIKRRYNIDQDQ